MSTGGLSLRGRIGLRGWGVSFSSYVPQGDHDPSAPQTVEPSLVRTAAAPPFGEGPQTQPARPSSTVLLPRSVPSTIMPLMSSNIVQNDKDIDQHIGVYQHGHHSPRVSRIHCFVVRVPLRIPRKVENLPRGPCGASCLTSRTAPPATWKSTSLCGAIAR